MKTGQATGQPVCVCVSGDGCNKASRLGGFNNRDLFSPGSGDRKSKVEVSL